MTQEADRELLELAAKAAGYIIVQWCGPLNAQYPTCISADGSSRVWSPLTDDGDALRLAVKRKILRCHMDLFHKFYEEEIANCIEEGAATRRAIVRAAASIGKDL